jgi:hypothetical protein
MRLPERLHDPILTPRAPNNTRYSLHYTHRVEKSDTTSPVLAKGVMLELCKLLLDLGMLQCADQVEEDSGIITHRGVGHRETAKGNE